MVIDPRTSMTVLDEDACWQLLGSTELARLAVAVGDDLEVFPVNIVLDGRSIVFTTGEGTKLAAMAVAGNVVVEADGIDDASRLAWSVVVRGRAERLERFTDIYRAEELRLPSWTAHPRQWFVRIHCDQISGRSFPLPPDSPSGDEQPLQKSPDGRDLRP